jgi:serine/threonine protein kinase
MAPSLAIFLVAVAVPGIAGLELVELHRSRAVPKEKQYGAVKVPVFKVNNLPPDCLKFPCNFEAVGNMSTALATYEDRLLTCGEYGWVRNRQVGKGHVSPVWNISTPCGNTIAAKFARMPTPLDHVAADCVILKHLTERMDRGHCVGCVPRYYHLGNVSGTCYSELVHAVPISMYFRHINQTLPRELLPIVKTTLREGLEVLAFLQSAKVRHQDLTFRNILIRAAGGTSTKPRVLFLDFGGSSWPPRAVPTPFTLASWVIGANLTRFRLRANTSHTFTTMLRHASTLAVGYPLL